MTMKAKGRSAWLITWEGPDAKDHARCKIVAILPSQTGENTIEFTLKLLFCSEYPLTLAEKLFFGTGKRNETPRFLQRLYTEINVAYSYGHVPHEYLYARRVKNLRCEESKTDDCEFTLSWTELPKYIPAPLDPSEPLPADLSKLSKMVVGERHESYTYSTPP